MLKRFVVVVALFTVFAVPRPARALDPVTSFVAGYLAGKLVDEVWDGISGKPNVYLLDSRLADLEKKATLNADMREAITKLRKQVNANVTKDEFKKMATKLADDLADIKKRLDEIDERLEMLEVKGDDRDNKTENAKDPEYFIKRGNEFRWGDKSRRALACFNIAIHLAKDETQGKAYGNRARAYKQMGLVEVSLVDFDQAAKLAPKEAAIFYDRATTHFELKQWTEAIQDYTACINLKDKTYLYSAYSTRGNAYHDRYVLAWGNGTKKDLEYAIADKDKAIELSPNWASAWDYGVRGVCYKHLDKPDLAVKDLNKAIELDSKTAWFYYRRSEAAKALAAADDKKAQELSSKQ